MQRWISWRTASLIALGLALACAPAAAADDFYIGNLDGQEDSTVLIDRGAKKIDQIAFSTEEKCKLNGEPSKPESGAHEMKKVRVSDRTFKADRRVAAAMTGATPPKYELRAYIRGEFRGATVDVHAQTKYIDRHHGDILKCRSGKLPGTLEKVARRRYEQVLEDKYPFFPPRP